jgi:hypothetical protein
MKKPGRFLTAVLVASAPLWAQHADPASDKERNIRAYIELLRADAREQKTAVLTAVLDLSDADGAKFWPIYKEYEGELSKSWDARLKLIRDYAANYENLTDAKAHEIVMALFDLDSARDELKKKYYLRVEQATSSTIAARFLQVENQLLMLIDLQVASSLPIVKR